MPGWLARVETAIVAIRLNVKIDVRFMVLICGEMDVDLINLLWPYLNDPPNPLKKGGPEPDSKSPFLRGMHGGSSSIKAIPP
jgi:hypothetical protein